MRAVVVVVMSRRNAAGIESSLLCHTFLYFAVTLGSEGISLRKAQSLFQVGKLCFLAFWSAVGNIHSDRRKDQWAR